MVCGEKMIFGREVLFDAPYVEATITVLLETSPEISAKVLKAESAKK